MSDTFEIAQDRNDYNRKVGAPTVRRSPDEVRASLRKLVAGYLKYTSTGRRGGLSVRALAEIRQARLSHTMSIQAQRMGF